MATNSASTASVSPDTFPTILGHPRPLWMLFMSEFWERFAFYGIRWALVLYIVAISVISLLCVLRLAETSRKDISG